MRHGARWTKLFVMLDCSLTCYPLTTQKIKILKKWKKAWKYYYFTQVYHKWQSHDVWFLRYEAWQTDFLSFGPFWLFYPTNNPKNQNFEKWKFAADIIILHICTKNHNKMMYCSWDTEWDRQNFCHFGSFMPF